MCPPHFLVSMLAASLPSLPPSLLSTQPAVLYNIAGYLLSWEGGREELVQALGQVVRVWCDRSAMQHSPLVQHLYISEALVLFATCAAERSEGQLNQMGVSTPAPLSTDMRLHQCVCVAAGREKTARGCGRVGSDSVLQ